MERSGKSKITKGVDWWNKIRQSKGRAKGRIKTTDKNVKKSKRRDKRQWLDGLGNEGEAAANNGNVKGDYDITKLLGKKKPKQTDSIKELNAIK